MSWAALSKPPCPTCGRASPGYDTRERRWRHLDTCQYQTILVAAVPRVECPEDGVVQVDVPWSEKGSGFTALFESLVIDWLHEAPISAVGHGESPLCPRTVRERSEAPQSHWHIGCYEADLSVPRTWRHPHFDIRDLHHTLRDRGHALNESHIVLWPVDAF